MKLVTPRTYPLLVIFCLLSIVFCLYKSGGLPFINKPLIVRHMGEVIRQPIAAGTFYPNDPTALYHDIKRYLGAEPSLGYTNVRAVLVPHAGYVYSGAVAASAFREVSPDFTRVFILASHHNGDVTLSGVSLTEVSHYAIPGAKIPLDGVVDELKKNPLFVHEPLAHTMQMIEVELPFLHALKGLSEKPEFTIIPMIVGALSKTQTEELAQILNKYNDAKTLFVFSVDLSHYFNAKEALTLDARTIDALMGRDTTALDSATTDGNQVLQVLTLLAQINEWEPALTKHGHSGEINTTMERVVGYAGMVFHKPFALKPEEQKSVLDFVRKTIEGSLTIGKTAPDASEMTQLVPVLGSDRASFVTLKKNNALRGCMGNLMPQTSLIDSLQANALKAAFEDPRFTPVTAEEMPNTHISISILDYPQKIVVDDPLKYPDTIKPNIDGVIIQYKNNHSTYLPSVWEEIPDPVMFLSSLCRKQDAPMTCWQDREAQLYRYRAFVFEE